MNTKRKILAVTGARSEYDLMFSIYEKLEAHPDVDFSLVITGPHLSEQYGLTARFAEADGFRVADKIYNLLDSNEKLARVASIGHQIPLLVQTLSREQPDIVLVAGDREEAISVALTCAYMDIAVAHFFGGDIAKDGNIDNAVRYAASKFAHLHFPTLEAHKQTLLKLGEDDWRIFVVGNPALDRFLAIPEQNKQEVLAGFPAKLPENITDYVVLIQHAIITEVDKQAEHIRITLEAIHESGKVCFVNYPNSDSGSHDIISAYEEWQRKYPEQFILFKNLDRITYVNLLRNASCLLGNSSSGLLEAPSLGLPAINIGSRQRGRAHGDNVIFVDNDKTQILEALKRTQNDTAFKSRVAQKQNPYGNGNTAQQVVDVLTSITINNNLIHKNITY